MEPYFKRHEPGRNSIGEMTAGHQLGISDSRTSFSTSTLGSTGEGPDRLSIKSSLSLEETEKSIHDSDQWSGGVENDGFPRKSEFWDDSAESFKKLDDTRTGSFGYSHMGGGQYSKCGNAKAPSAFPIRLSASILLRETVKFVLINAITNAQTNAFKHTCARSSFEVNLTLTGTTGLNLQRLPRLATLYILS
jgi:hypothetical protein